MNSKSNAKFSGLQKAAAIIHSIDHPLAIRLLKRCEQDEVKEIACASSKLDQVSSKDVQEFMREFMENVLRTSLFEPTQDRTERLLLDALPAYEASAVISDIYGDSGSRIWRDLKKLNRDEVAKFISQLDISIISYSLSKLEPTFAAEIFALLPDDLRSQVAVRMTVSHEPPPEIEEIVLKVLKERVLDVIHQNSLNTSATRIATFLTKLPPQESQSIIAVIERYNPSVAAEVAKGMFNFDDLMNLTANALTIVVQSISPDRLIVALNGAAPIFSETILSALGTRTRRLVESEINVSNVADESAIEDARRYIEGIVIELNKKGAIDLNVDLIVPSETTDIAIPIVGAT